MTKYSKLFKVFEFNIGIVNEFSICKDKKKDNKPKHQEPLETIEGFPSYLYNQSSIDKILLCLKQDLNTETIDKFFEKYTDSLYTNYLKQTIQFNRIEKPTFLKQQLEIEQIALQKIDSLSFIDDFDNFKLACQKFFDWILRLVQPQQNEKQKDEQEAPKTFDELFYNIELVQQSIDILKEIEPPLIDSDSNYIGKLKGIICLWIDELQRQGIVKHYSDRKIFASLIPQKIKRFSIDESMFGKYHHKAENNYRTDIKTKVSKIKLSQNSQ